MTSTQAELLKQFSALTADSARFRRVVLHAHSPESYDYGDKPNADKLLNEKTQYLRQGGETDFIARIRGNYDLIAITDHMKFEYATRLARATLSEPGFQILPGIELNVRLSPPMQMMRLHILAIFPPEREASELERIFPASMPPDSRRTGNEEMSEANIAQLVSMIGKHGGLCIAAHVESDNGIRKSFRQTGKSSFEMINRSGIEMPDDKRQMSEAFKDYLIQSKFHGIEVKRAEDRKHYVWETEVDGKRHHVPVFLTLDAHCIEDYGQPDRVTYVKMSDVSFRGLREAIRFPQTRIRFTDDRVPPPHILGISIHSPGGEGFFDNALVGFVENLNCVIGARGSGKSTLVEAFRYVFGYNRTLGQLESHDLVSAIRARQKRNLAGSIIRICYRLANKQIHTLEATYDDKADYSTRVYDGTGAELAVRDVERSGDYPFRLFGWSEIEMLGRDSRRQRELLDKLVEGLAPLIDAREEIRAELGSNQKEILAVSSRLDALLSQSNGMLLTFKARSQEFNRLNTPDAQALFDGMDRVQKQIGFLRTGEKVLAARVVQARGTAAPLGWPDPGNPLDQSIATWWAELNGGNLLFDASVAVFRDSVARAIDCLDDLQSRIGQAREVLENTEQTTSAKIRALVASDDGRQLLANLREAAKQRLDEVTQIRRTYLEHYDEFKRLMRLRDEIIRNLIDSHSKVSDARNTTRDEIEGKLNEFQTDNMRISIQLLKDRDRSLFERWLSERPNFLSEAHRQFKSQKLPQLVSAWLAPVSLATAIIQRDPKYLSAPTVSGDTAPMPAEQASRFLEACAFESFDDQGEVHILNGEKLKNVLELQEVKWDDAQHILRNGIPVEEASPGQRSSAMLPLIAMSEQVPLLIDQPEDNLDNRLVGKVLVDILIKLKERRQIIVMTHNPNIVVLGDAEQVVSLEAASDKKGSVEVPQASIDHPHIIKKVIELLEGGQEAFDTRNTRYATNET